MARKKKNSTLILPGGDGYAVKPRTGPTHMSFRDREVGGKTMSFNIGKEAMREEGLGLLFLATSLVKLVDSKVCPRVKLL